MMDVRDEELSDEPIIWRTALLLILYICRYPPYLEIYPV
jgi:hypothetical protein